LSGCGFVTASGTVSVTPVPTLTASGTTVCKGSTGQISASPSPGGGTFLWSPGGDTTSSLLVSPATTTDYTVTYSLNGCSASDTVTVTINPLPVIQLSITNASCGVQNGKIVANATGATGPYSYYWSNLSDVSTPVDSALAAGTYNVRVFDQNGCSASASATIIQLSAVSATATVKPFPCAQPPYGNVTIVATGGLAPYTYTVTGQSPNTTGQFNNLAPNEYSYTVTDSTECPVNGSFVIPAGYAKDSFDITADSTSCYGLHDGSVIVTPIDTPNSPYTYSINGGVAQSSTTFDSLPGGDYQVIINNGIGCSDTLNTIINQPTPVTLTFNPDTITIVNHDTTPALNPITSGFISPVYFWSPSQGLSCSNCPNPTATVYDPTISAPTVYYLLVSDSLNSNCKAYDSIVILIKGQFMMPDAFTPNGDGKNDEFGPVTYSYLTIKEFHIYNRWGQLVHNSTELWDGKFKGEPQPVGTYVYYIVVEYPNPANPATNITAKKEGSVVLLR
jgi:gliding motility-associated-like protein